MKTLGEIIESAKSGGRPEYDELRYALCALDSLSTFDQMDLLRSPTASELSRTARANESFRRWKMALKGSPKDWLGTEDDPDSPKVQERRIASLKLFNKVIKQTG